MKRNDPLPTDVQEKGLGIVRHFFTGTGPTYDRIVSRFTLGFDGLWKRKILAEIPPGSKRIMDQACGTGILTFRIAEKFPAARIVGVDVTEEYLQVAREKAARRGVGNVEFILGRAEDVLLAGGFDCVTSSYLAKYADLALLIPHLRTMLREGGVVVMHDFTYPEKRWFALLWEVYCRLMRAFGTRRYPQWKNVFADLPGFLRKTTWVRDLTGALQENHFSAIAVRRLTCGAAALVTARKGPA
jgi:demethylmenaquinone methyltransferase/2-methoxy-6-polyprenyl-1,4-benzoquinol methylase